MTDSDAEPLLHDLEHATAHASDAAAAWLSSLSSLGRSVRAAHAAKHPLNVIGRELRQGRASARQRRARALIRPSIRLAEHSAEVIAAAADGGLGDVRVFGSCVRRTDTRLSDVDLIVSTGPHTSLIDVTAFAIDVADLLGLPEERVDVVTDGALRPGSGSAARIAAECQPLAAWATGWPRLDSLPWWLFARAAGASEEELIQAVECGLHRWGGTYTVLRYLPAGRPAAAPLVDPDEVDRVVAVLAAYADARTGGLDHDAAITRVVTWISSAIG